MVRKILQRLVNALQHPGQGPRRDAVFSTIKTDGGLSNRSERASLKMTSDPTTPLRKSLGVSLRRSPEKFTHGTPQKAR